jgi:hypothetical protein
MEPWLILLIAFLATVMALFCLWLFLIAPRARKKAVKPFLRPYAHRGLWGGEIPENSLAAFRRAAQYDPLDSTLDAAIDKSQRGIVADFLNRYRR